ncbi:metallophosphoesterase [Candidatus Pacearchaeota archaeon]|nr:metallophosphoesterase [Candidatus Pacearchaeota archaeon]
MGAQIKYLGKCLLIEVSGKRILVIGDLHLGFEESLNESGILVSRRMFDEMVEELDGLFDEIGRVDEIVLLGDVKHAFGRVIRQEWNEVLKLIDYFSEKCDKIIIIKGNHDRAIELIARKRENVEVKDFYCCEEVCFLHGDRDFAGIYRDGIKYWIIGHGHPAVKIKEKGGVRIEKYKCFLIGKFKDKKVIIAPSFFDYSEGSDPRENDLRLAWKFDLRNFDVWIVSGLGVLEFGKLRKLI